MTVVTRFAPSPTGRLHVGNIRAATLNWLLARQKGGRFLLRLDDTDRARSTQAFADGIDADLAWLGFHPDARVRQSDRDALYEAVFQRLREVGRVYPCYETPEELEMRRKVLLSRRLPPIYDRAALALTDADRARLEADGVRPHWRFRLDHGAMIEWHDEVRGASHLDPRLTSDPVVRRADGSWLYLLPSVIDDIDMGVTDIIRGEDHVTNSGLQLQMFEALGAPRPRLAHVALLTGGEGKLSKRLGASGVDALRAAGIEPLAVIALLARLGTSDPVVPVADVGPLVESFDLGHFGRAPARFDEAELAALNQRIIHLMPYDAVADRLPAGMDEDAWAAIRPNLATVAEAADWWTVVEGPVTATVAAEDRDFLRAAAEAAERIDWSGAPWSALVEALKADTGRKGKPLFLPLRQALTGRDHGPEMAALLPLIGPVRAVARLRDAAGG